MYGRTPREIVPLFLSVLQELTLEIVRITSRKGLPVRRAQSIADAALPVRPLLNIGHKIHLYLQVHVQFE